MFGWGAVVQWWNNSQGELVACTWDPVEAEDAEAHREAKGGVYAPAAALRFACGVWNDLPTMLRLCADPLSLLAPDSAIGREVIDAAC